MDQLVNTDGSKTFVNMFSRGCETSLLFKYTQSKCFF